MRIIKIVQRYFVFKTNVEVVLIGAPNVGKSTLFNNLTNDKSALVHPTPGLTRDCQNKKIDNVLGLPVHFNDTPGLLLSQKKNEITSLEIDMKKRVEEVIKKSDLVFFMVDAKNGLCSIDEDIKKWLKEFYDNKNIVLLGNKADDEFIQMSAYNDIYSFWEKDVIFISALQGLNIHQIWQKIDTVISDEEKENFANILKTRKRKIKNFKKELEKEYKEIAKEDPNFDIKDKLKEFEMLNRDAIYNSDLDNDNIPLNKKLLIPKVQTPRGISYDNKNKNMPITVAVIGRPNAGKSSLINYILKENIVITSEEANTTRDPIEIPTNFKGRKIILTDTAGLNKNMISDRKSVEGMIYYRTLNTIRYAQIHIIVVDVLNAFRVRDLDLIQKSVSEGRGTIVIVNKWDLMDAKLYKKAIQYMKNQLRENLGSEKLIPVLFGCALTGQGLKDLQDTILNVYENWNIRISTGLLNDWLQRFKKLPENDYKSFITKDAIMNILFVTQIKTRPPTFAFFVNDVDLFKKNVTKFFKAQLCEEFKLFGVPINLEFRGVSHKEYIKYLESLERNQKNN